MCRHIKGLFLFWKPSEKAGGLKVLSKHEWLRVIHGKWTVLTHHTLLVISDHSKHLNTTCCIHLFTLHLWTDGRGCYVICPSVLTNLNLRFIHTPLALQLWRDWGFMSCPWSVGGGIKPSTLSPRKHQLRKQLWTYGEGFSACFSVRTYNSGMMCVSKSCSGLMWGLDSECMGEEKENVPSHVLLVRSVIIFGPTLTWSAVVAAVSLTENYERSFWQHYN